MRRAKIVRVFDAAIIVLPQAVDCGASNAAREKEQKRIDTNA